MNNALSRWMIAASHRGATTSPLVQAARVHGAGVLVPLYVGAVVLSLIIGLAVTPESAGGAAILRVVVTVIWIGVGAVFVFTGTLLAHQLATWGIGLIGALAAFGSALWDFAVASLLGAGWAALGVFDLLIAAGFTIATIAAARTVQHLSSSAAPPVGTPFPGGVPTVSRAQTVPVATDPAPTGPVSTGPSPEVTQPVVNPVSMDRASTPNADAAPPVDPTAVTASTPTAPPNPFPYTPGPPPMQTPMYMGAPRRQNSLATPALILGVIVPPVGIVLGHVSLSQIKRTNEEGRSLATAGLVVGYVFTGIAVASWIAIIAFTASLSNSIDRSLSDLSTPTTTYDYPTTTTDTTTADSSQAAITAVIRSASIGSCVHRETSGSTITSLYNTDCSSYDANYRVSDRVSSTSSCSTTDWVYTSVSDTDSSLTVLCLTSE